MRRIYYLSPGVILGNSRGRVIEPARLRRVFRLRQLTGQVRQHGQIRLYNFGIYRGLPLLSKGRKLSCLTDVQHYLSKSME